MEVWTEDRIKQLISLGSLLKNIRDLRTAGNFLDNIESIIINAGDLLECSYLSQDSFVDFLKEQVKKEQQK